ncbi:hypothetical protein [Bacillus paramycoides]|uniref:hypothetical protein n=1 Tax=Bacillus paramycoides TaxID=2026194 RepID=UPI003D028E95
MKVAFIIIIIIVGTVAGMLVYNANLTNDGLTLWGFYLSLFGLIVSVGGTVLSWLSFVNAKAAKIAADQAKKQFLKGKQNIDLSQLHKQGNEVREKVQKLTDKSYENHEDILMEVELFALRCEDISPSINVNNYGFSTKPQIIRTEVNNYRRHIYTPDRFDHLKIVSTINSKITEILTITQDQMDKNIE